MRKQFVFGIGAQKAGTSWLSARLRAEPHFKVGKLKQKELHVWDAREVPEQRNWQVKKSLFTTRQRRLLWSMQNTEGFYFDCFSALLKDGGLAADITPSYSALSSKTLRRVESQFTANGIDFSAVFIMRDPVSRCVSAFNMNHGRLKAGKDQEGVLRNDDHNQAFRDYFASSHAAFRTRYERTLFAMRESFSPEQMGTFVYEALFSRQEQVRLQEFLGISDRPDFVKVRSNVAKKKLAFGEEVLSECALHFQNTYRAIEKDFPETRTLWGGWKYLS